MTKKLAKRQSKRNFLTKFEELITLSPLSNKIRFLIFEGPNSNEAKEWLPIFCRVYLLALFILNDKQMAWVVTLDVIRQISQRDFKSRLKRRFDNWIFNLKNNNDSKPKKPTYSFDIETQKCVYDLTTEKETELEETRGLSEDDQYIFFIKCIMHNSLENGSDYTFIGLTRFLYDSTYEEQKKIWKRLNHDFNNDFLQKDDIKINTATIRYLKKRFLNKITFIEDELLRCKKQVDEEYFNKCLTAFEIWGTEDYCAKEIKALNRVDPIKREIYLHHKLIHGNLYKCGFNNQPLFVGLRYSFPKLESVNNNMNNSKKRDSPDFNNEDAALIEEEKILATKKIKEIFEQLKRLSCSSLIIKCDGNVIGSDINFKKHGNLDFLVPGSANKITIWSTEPNENILLINYFLISNHSIKYFKLHTGQKIKITHIYQEDLDKYEIKIYYQEPLLRSIRRFSFENKLLKFASAALLIAVVSFFIYYLGKKESPANIADKPTTTTTEKHDHAIKENTAPLSNSEQANHNKNNSDPRKENIPLTVKKSNNSKSRDVLMSPNSPGVNLAKAKNIVIELDKSMLNDEDIINLTRILEENDFNIVKRKNQADTRLEGNIKKDGENIIIQLSLKNQNGNELWHNPVSTFFNTSRDEALQLTIKDLVTKRNKEIKEE